jgi:uncharacterized protein
MQLAARLRAHPGLLAKLDLTTVTATIGGNGDDAAVVDGDLVLCAEAIEPGFIEADPRVAGIAAVVTCLNDIAACGGRPIALLDTVVAPTREVATLALDGIRIGAERYGVPVVGGHTTIAPGVAQISSFALGRAKRPLRAANARPGDEVVFVTCLEGELIESPGGVCFYTHLRGSRGSRAEEDLALIADIAEAGDAWACRDISMPGLVGSLLQFLESAGGLGAVLNLDRIPTPAGAVVEAWLGAFSSYGFLVVGDATAITQRVRGVGLTAECVATLDDTGRLIIRHDLAVETFWDLSSRPLTGLRPPD